mmetsp:Transcript_18780/g.26916  ORF Transcript_18780/g.26916 Transcript_18780/m.26916 type:complete len:183 (-) Transcript_18780:252-800(-)
MLKFDQAQEVEFWLSASSVHTVIWSEEAKATWLKHSVLDRTSTEMTTILPAFVSLREQHYSDVWTLVDTHAGWERTTQDLVLHLKDKAFFSPVYVGAIIELTGQDEDPFVSKAHKAKFIRDLLRMHALRGSVGTLHGVITDMCRIILFQDLGSDRQSSHPAYQCRLHIFQRVDWRAIGLHGC